MFHISCPESELIVTYRRRTCALVLLGMAGLLALTPAAAEAQRGRRIARAAAGVYLNRGYGGNQGGYGYSRYNGSYNGSYNSGYGRGYYGGGNSWNGYGGGYPSYGYNRGYGAGYPSYGYNRGYGGGYPGYGYGRSGISIGIGTTYGGGGYRGF